MRARSVSTYKYNVQVLRIFYDFVWVGLSAAEFETIRTTTAPFVRSNFIHVYTCAVTVKPQIFYKVYQQACILVF